MDKFVQALATAFVTVGLLLAVCAASYNPYTMEGMNVGLGILGLLLAMIGGGLLGAIDKNGRHEKK